MRLFLASSLCFVSDIISSQIDLAGKTVGCIWNAADMDGAKDARWNQWDLEFFEQQGAITIDIDLRDTIDLDRILESIDILFVGGGDTLYLADLAREVKLRDHLPRFWDKGGIYCGTSAGSMLACHEVYYPHPGRSTQGLGLIDAILIPHRSSPGFERERLGSINQMYHHHKPYIMLTDIDVLVVHNNQWSIERSKQRTLEEVFVEIEKID